MSHETAHWTLDSCPMCHESFALSVPHCVCVVCRIKTRCAAALVFVCASMPTLSLYSCVNFEVNLCSVCACFIKSSLFCVCLSVTTRLFSLYAWQWWHRTCAGESPNLLLGSLGRNGQGVCGCACACACMRLCIFASTYHRETMLFIGKKPR